MAKGYSARRGFSNGSGQMLKQQQMQQQIMKMQEDMQKAQQEVEEKTFSASVGGGVVSAEVNGKKEVTNITIKPEAVDPEDVEMLQDLIIFAVNERPVKGTRGWHRTAMRHGVSSVREGQRFTLGIIFHDAA